MTKHLVYLTGTRADYSPMRSILLALNNDPTIDLGLVVTGMHLMRRYGYTVQLVEKDRLRIIRSIPVMDEGDSPASMVAAMSYLMQPLTGLLESINPDGLLVTGDRGEMLAAAICAAHLDIPVLHFCGGSVSGSIDDSIRHAITRFAHIHFPSTRRSLKNLIRMGEDADACFLVGLPGADLKADATVSRQDIESALGFSLDRRYVVVIQHPVTHERQLASQQIMNTLKAVTGFGMQVLVFLPNADAGSEAICSTILSFAKMDPSLHVLSNLPRNVFASLLAGCSALIGNSSCGLGEAVSLGIPVVNIGTRQRGRERMGNTIDVGCSVADIRAGIDRALSSDVYHAALKSCQNEYLSINMEDNVVSILKGIDFRAFVPKKPLWPRETDRSGI